MLGSVDIKDHMLKNPVTISPDALLSEAVSSILHHKISGLCVVDSNKQLLGVLSELDCLKGYIAATYNSASMGNVADYMTREVDVVDVHENIINVANDMMSKNQRRRPVIQDGKLIGQISCRQLLHAVKEFSSNASYA